MGCKMIACHKGIRPYIQGQAVQRTPALHSIIAKSSRDTSQTRRSCLNTNSGVTIHHLFKHAHLIAWPESLEYRLSALAWRMSKSRRPAQSSWRNFKYPAQCQCTKCIVNPGRAAQTPAQFRNQRIDRLRKGAVGFGLHTAAASLESTACPPKREKHS